MSPRCSIVLALLALPALAAPAAAAEPAALRLSLAEALERARAASPRLAQLDAQQAAAAAAVRVAQAQRLPDVHAAAGYTRLSHVDPLAITLPGRAPVTVFPDLPNAWRTRLEATAPLWTGGRLTAAADAARAEATATRADGDTGRLDLGLETAAAYWTLVTAREAERVVGEAVATYAAHLKDAQNRERFGLAAANEVLAVQVEHDRAALAHIVALGNVEKAQIDIARLLGLDDGVAVDPSEPLEAGDAPPPPLDELVQRAFAARPERAALAARAGAAEAAVRAEKSQRMPQLAAAAGYDYANPNRRIVPNVGSWRGSWDVGVALAVPVWDFGRVSAAAAQRTAQRDALLRARDDLDRRIRADVAARVVDVGAARAALPVAARALDAAREAQRVAGERYRAGVALNTDLLDAETTLLRAGLERTAALAQLRLALARLDRTVGR